MLWLKQMIASDARVQFRFRPNRRSFKIWVTVEKIHIIFYWQLSNFDGHGFVIFTLRPCMERQIRKRESHQSSNSGSAMSRKRELLILYSNQRLLLQKCMLMSVQASSPGWSTPRVAIQGLIKSFGSSSLNAKTIRKHIVHRFYNKLYHCSQSE